MFELVMKSRPC